MPTFQDLSFKKYEDNLRVSLYDLFYFDIPHNQLSDIGPYNFTKNSINFKNISEKRAQNKFTLLLNKNFPRLKTRLQDKKALYIHQNSEIPLIGTPFIGIVDRNTTCIEVKPITGCNIGCTFCSVDEGINTKKEIDMVVEKDYLVQELTRFIDTKFNIDVMDANLEICINAHGEPTTYQPLPQLISDISNISKVKTISLITNATLLSKAKVDDLINAGLTKFNVSINAIDPILANKLANTSINIERIKSITRYMATRCKVTIAPVLLNGLNENSLKPIIDFAKSISTSYDLRVAVQNFLPYKKGRNPVTQIPWDDFYASLHQLEKTHDIKLIYDLEEDFDITKTKPLPKPFHKGEKIKAKIVSVGRYLSDRIAVKDDRCIVIPNSNAPINSTVKLLITGDKHNIFHGQVI